MTFKSKDFWKFLPFGSGINYGEDGYKKDPFPLREFTMVAHATYAAILPIYFIVAIVNRNLNPRTWIIPEQEYSALVQKASVCVEEDGTSGLNPHELEHLYELAGVNYQAPEITIRPNFKAGSAHNIARTLQIPKLTTQQLETVVNNEECIAKE